MKYLIPLFCLLLFASCDTGTTYERVLINQTDKQITITFHHQYQSIQDYPQGPVIALPHTTTLLFKNSGLGGHPDAVDPMQHIDSVEVFIDSLVLQKDIMQPGNWASDIQPNANMGFKKSYYHKYTFVINSSDIE